MTDTQWPTDTGPKDLICTRTEDPLHLPRIVLSPRDRDQLSAIAIFCLIRDPRSAGALLDKIDRADIQPESSIDSDVVGLGSIVTFSEDRRPEVRTARVVLPTGVGDDPAQISVLGTVGAGLVGLRTGQSILWADRLGSGRMLTVLRAIRRPC